MTKATLATLIISLSSLIIACGHREFRTVEIVKQTVVTPTPTPNRTATVLPSTDGDVTVYPMPRQDITVLAPGESDASENNTSKPVQQGSKR